MTLAVYEDYKHVKAPLLRWLDDSAGPGSWRLVSAADILNGYLNSENPSALIMPGGADLYFCEKLNGMGNQAIRDYVRQGGGYLGICAGAYYGCNSLKWLEGTGQEISGPRELAFGDIEALGPIPEFIDGPPEENWSPGRAITIEIPATSQKYSVFYHGGPKFNIGSGQDVKIHAKFQDPSGLGPAIIELAYGVGTVILSSVHLEMRADNLRAMSYTVLDADFKASLNDLEMLDKSEAQLNNLGRLILDRLYSTNVSI